MPRSAHVTPFLAAFAILFAGCGKSSRKPEKPAPPPLPPRITLLYATPNIIEDGQSTQLCYSVEDTAKVFLDPPVDRVWPALARCLEVKPARSTTYELTAVNTAGTAVRATTRVKVVPAGEKQPGVQIINVSKPAGSIESGQGFQFCVHARNAKDWKLSAGKWLTDPDATGGCVIDHPLKTTVYIITAIGASGETDSTRVTATVN